MKRIFAFVIWAGMVSVTPSAYSGDLYENGRLIDQNTGKTLLQQKKVADTIRSSAVLYDNPSSLQFEQMAESKAMLQQGQPAMTEINVTSNGNNIMPARIQTGGKYLSATDLAREVQANFSFDSEKETVSLNKGKALLSFRVGEKGLTIGQTTYFLNSPSKMENNIVMVPECQAVAIRQIFGSF